MLREFLLHNYGFLTSLVEIIAAVSGILVYKKYKNTVVKYFIYFLIYVAVLELIGGYTSYVTKYEFLKPIKEFLKGTWAEKNYQLYNIFWGIVAPIFYSYYFSMFINGVWAKKIIKVCQVFFVVTALSYIFLSPEELFDNIISLNGILGAALVLMPVSLYFIEILRSDYIITFYKSINFYISSIVFIWYLVLTPITFFNIYFSASDWDFVFLKWEIYLSMNIFMYLGFAIALLYCKPQRGFD